MTRLEKFRRDVGGEIDQSIRQSGVDRGAIADRTGMNYKTLCRKISDPAELKLRELMRISEAMGMSLTIQIRGKENEERVHRSGRMARRSI